MQYVPGHAKARCCLEGGFVMMKAMKEGEAKAINVMNRCERLVLCIAWPCLC